jgi:hypothetical protein
MMGVNFAFGDYENFHAAISAGIIPSDCFIVLRSNGDAEFLFLDRDNNLVSIVDRNRFESIDEAMSYASDSRLSGKTISVFDGAQWRLYIIQADGSMDPVVLSGDEEPRISLDKTLTISGMAADAKAVGDTIEIINNMLQGKVPEDRTINGKPLSDDIVLYPRDIGADPSGSSYTKEESDGKYLTSQAQSDWEQTDDKKADYIKNKPHLGALASLDTLEEKDVPDTIARTKTVTALAGRLDTLEAILEAVLVKLENGGDGDVPLAAGLYQTGAIALYKEQGADAIEGMMIKSWEQLLDDGTVHVEGGGLYTNMDKTTWVNSSADILVGDLMLPNDGSIATILENAFDGCTSLTSIDIPDGVTSIGGDAFYGCSALTSITIPDSVTSISSSAFECCDNDNLTIYCEAESQPSELGEDWSIFGRTIIWGYAGSLGVTEDGFEWADTKGGVTIYKYSGSNVDVIIPTMINDMKVVSIADKAFINNKTVTSITIPDGITSIGDCAFQSCEVLSSVTISGSVKTIGYEAFGRCEGLANATIAEGVECIGEYAFASSFKVGFTPGSSALYLPSTITEIQSRAFAQTALTDVYYNGTCDQFRAIINKAGDLFYYNSIVVIHCTDGDYDWT